MAPHRRPWQPVGLSRRLPVTAAELAVSTHLTCHARHFAAEVTRVALEVGTEGELGGQAKVSGVSGTWRDLTESVNGMAANLTTQVRNIAQVTTAVARGDLGKKITMHGRATVPAKSRSSVH